jgi:hypothetical protein
MWGSAHFSRWLVNMGRRLAATIACVELSKLAALQAHRMIVRAAGSQDANIPDGNGDLSGRGGARIQNPVVRASTPLGKDRVQYPLKLLQ